MSYLNTPYDDVCRTLVNDCRKLIIPVVNEVFDEDYTGDEQIILNTNEIYLRQQDGAGDKRITDSSFTIIGKEGASRYHLECQSTTDGSMLVRMYEYDSQIALQEGILEKGILNVNFPQSAILYLRHTRNTPDVMKICINTPNGSVSYDVPVLKVKNYSVESIFEKKLYFLIPFHIFAYEESFKVIEESTEQLQALKETYGRIIQRLDELCLQGQLDEYTKKTICEMSETVLKHIAEKYENIKEEVTKVMGGTVLEYEAKNILRQGIEQGIEQGMEQGIEHGIELTLCSLVKKGLITVEKAAAELNLSVEEFQNKMKKIKV